MTTDIDVNVEPLPGYRLIEHIGAGGYGEVWRCEAPGGLTKAIKFVFGQQHEKRATNELRALDHVRSVRHPFLLSLERIEVVDGRLLVVTELAEGSLKDHFDACRRDGLGGIPRAELLGYLRDAADALDFMNESHALQHLDIKPENLLMLAGHIKVADFGLVKDIRKSQASLVGGMTPLYASPEVFRGIPSRQSDQYSLAIVYQEMLTGTLPFCGGNAAELTLQHLKDEPDLGALTTMDRYAVSRALSKDPQHRYSTCREFVEALFKATSAEATFHGAEPQERNFAESAAPSCTPPRQSMPTDFFEVGDAADWSTGGQPLLVELPTADCTVIDLPAIELKPHEWQPAPTLLLGIGGAAGRVLTHFRHLIHQQCGGAHVPAVQLLLLDTDSRSLSDAGRRGDAGLTPDETLDLPLRRPQHYREHAQQLLGWLSRRWLYNIPRTLRTEGLRPLGRLALADHARQAGQRIRSAMSQAIDSQSLAASTQVIGRALRSDALRVYVVASISGGTGGGIALDIGYAVRAILGKLGVADARVCGIMMHSTGGDPRHCELARVNALSWLTEFHHFQRLENAYPGDASCGLPPHSAEVPAFDNTYLLHLGENLNEVEFDQATQSVAEYLRLNTLTPAGEFFAAGRAGDEPSSQREPMRTLRSFGMFQRTAAPSELCDEFARSVSQRVIAAWQTTSTDSDISARTRLVRRLQLDANGIAGNTQALLELELGSDAATFLSNLLGTPLSAAEPGSLSLVDRLFGSDQGQESSELECAIQIRPVAASISPLREKLLKEMRRWIIAHVDDRAMRVVGARRQVAWLIEHFGAVKAELRHILNLVSKNLFELRREVCGVSPSSTVPASPDAGQQVLTYFCLRLDQMALLAAEHIVNALLSDAKGLADEMTSLAREIDQIANAVIRACGDTSTTSANRTLANAVTGDAGLCQTLQAKLPEVVNEVDERLQAEYVTPQGGLTSIVMGGGRPRAQLAAKLHELSRQVVQRAVSDISVVEQNSKSGDATASDLRCGLTAATPSLLEFGGTRRVLAVVPKDCKTASSQTISASFGAPVSVTQGWDNNLVVCVEADGLSIEHIAAAIVEHRRDRVEFAGRVHCRTDVSWTPLIDTTVSPESLDWSVGSESVESPNDAMCKTVVL